MAYSNVSRKRGFVPLSESVGHAHVERRPIPSARTASGGGNASTDMALGDAYALDVNGNAFRAGPNDVVRGVIIGFELAANPNVMNANGPISVDYVTGAGTWPQLIGIEDNKCLFECQSDTAAQSNVLGTFNLSDAAPDSTWRISQQSINVGGGAGSQIKLERIVDSPADNAAGTNAQVVVSFPQMTT